MQRLLGRTEMIRPLLSIAATACLVLMIEWGRHGGFGVPIPFLLLYASVVVAAGAAGMLGVESAVPWPRLL